LGEGPLILEQLLLLAEGCEWQSQCHRATHTKPLENISPLDLVHHGESSGDEL
jgi:hypothetical protein